MASSDDPSAQGSGGTNEHAGGNFGASGQARPQNGAPSGEPRYPATGIPVPIQQIIAALTPLSQTTVSAINMKVLGHIEAGILQAAKLPADTHMPPVMVPKPVGPPPENGGPRKTRWEPVSQVSLMATMGAALEELQKWKPSVGPTQISARAASVKNLARISTRLGIGNIKNPGEISLNLKVMVPKEAGERLTADENAGPKPEEMIDQSREITPTMPLRAITQEDLDNQQDRPKETGTPYWRVPSSDQETLVNLKTEKIPPSERLMPESSSRPNFAPGPEQAAQPFAQSPFNALLRNQRPTSEPGPIATPPAAPAPPTQTPPQATPPGNGQPARTLPPPHVFKHPNATMQNLLSSPPGDKVPQHLMPTLVDAPQASAPHVIPPTSPPNGQPRPTPAPLQNAGQAPPVAPLQGQPPRPNALPPPVVQGSAQSPAPPVPQQAQRPTAQPQMSQHGQPVQPPPSSGQMPQTAQGQAPRPPMQPNMSQTGQPTQSSQIRQAPLPPQQMQPNMSQSGQPLQQPQPNMGQGGPPMQRPQMPPQMSQHGQQVQYPQMPPNQQGSAQNPQPVQRPSMPPNMSQTGQPMQSPSPQGAPPYAQAPAQHPQMSQNGQPVQQAPVPSNASQIRQPAQRPTSPTYQNLTPGQTAPPPGQTAPLTGQYSQQGLPTSQLSQQTPAAAPPQGHPGNGQPAPNAVTNPPRTSNGHDAYSGAHSATGRSQQEPAQQGDAYSGEMKKLLDAIPTPKPTREVQGPIILGAGGGASSTAEHSSDDTEELEARSDRWSRLVNGSAVHLKQQGGAPNFFKLQILVPVICVIAAGSFAMFSMLGQKHDAQAPANGSNPSAADNIAPATDTPAGIAYQKYSAVIQSEPQNAAAYVGRGDAAMQLRRYDGAEADYTQAVAFAPDNDNYVLKRAAAAFYLKHYDKALVDYSGLLNKNPNSPSLYYGRALVRNKIGSSVQALEDLRKATELDKNYQVAYQEMSVANFNLKRYKEALAAADQAINMGPKSAVSEFNKATILHMMSKTGSKSKSESLNRAKSALECYNEAIALEPNRPDFYNDRGVAYRDLGRNTEAQRDFQKALLLNPNFQAAKTNLDSLQNH